LFIVLLVTTCLSSHGIIIQLCIWCSIWRWRQQDPLERWYLTTTLHDVTNQTTRLEEALCLLFLFAKIKLLY